MNGFSLLWKGVVDELNANTAILGIDGAERAATGKITQLMPPSAAVWLKPGVATTMSQNGAVTFPTDVFIFCVAAPNIREDDAVDGALEMAGKILRHLTNKEIAGAVLVQPDNEEIISIVERSSTAAVAGVLLKAEVNL